MRAPEGSTLCPLSCPAQVLPQACVRRATAGSKCPAFPGLSPAHSLDFYQLKPSVHLKLNGNQTQIFWSPLETGTMSGGSLAWPGRCPCCGLAGCSRKATSVLDDLCNPRHLPPRRKAGRLCILPPAMIPEDTSVQGDEVACSRSLSW